MKTFIEYLEERKLSSKDRKKLKKGTFGLPKERKFPLNDKKHVRAAMAYFGSCPADKKHSLARKIRAACNKFGIKINKDAAWYKYCKD